ncbi:prolipoprotein diacylglyceryl transferase [alpha proteobacterium U9-1i]|nr:prolipoprotein diacylglyceryl transferase [alpha proteobacterium U9-1i]
MIFEAIQFPNIDPAALTIPPIFGLGPFHLRWYALAYIAGLVLGWRWMVWLIRRDRLWAPNKPALSVPQADDFLFWATLGVILGGRLGYVLFYKPDMIWKNPVEILQIWQGGMSFHGGLIGVAIAAIWFTRQLHVDETQFASLAKKHAVAEPPSGERGAYMEFKGLGWLKKSEAESLREKTKTEKVDLLRLGDIAAAAAPIGLFFGRIANFINGELWGRVTDGPFGVVFCNDRLRDFTGNCAAGNEPRHPSQLYEAALEGVALFAIINIATLRFDSLRRPGVNTGLFLIFYGIFRAILETVREPDAHMPEALRGIVTMGMLLSIPMILIGAWLIRRAYVSPKLAAA